MNIKQLKILTIAIFCVISAFWAEVQGAEDIEIIKNAASRLNLEFQKYEDKIKDLTEENNKLKGLGQHYDYKLSILDGNNIESSFINDEELKGIPLNQQIRSAIVFGVSSMSHNGCGLHIIPTGINNPQYTTLSGKLYITNEGEKQCLTINSQSPIYGNQYGIIHNDQELGIKLNGFILSMSIGKKLEKTLSLDGPMCDRYISLNGNLVKMGKFDYINRTIKAVAEGLKNQDVFDEITNIRSGGNIVDSIVLYDQININDGFLEGLKDFFDFKDKDLQLVLCLRGTSVTEDGMHNFIKYCKVCFDSNYSGDDIMSYDNYIDKLNNGKLGIKIISNFKF